MHVRVSAAMLRRQENGAVAVIVAIVAIVLFASAAISVDLGNALVRKRNVQAQADFAALAGGGELGAEDAGIVPTAVVQAVADYLNGNQPLDSANPACSIDRDCVTTAQLVDGDISDREVQFVTGGLQVITPPAQVNFGFAAASNFQSAAVRADATVGLFSPGIGVMPVYAVSGCDYGNQTITDPAGGHVVDPTIPTLAYDSESNDTTLQSLSDHEVDYAATGVALTLDGKDFKDTTKVGFFRADDTEPTLIVEAVSFTAPDGTVYTNGDGTSYTKNGNAAISFVIPDQVTSVETAWYIRVYNDGTQDKWSARADAQPLRVGEAVLECASDGPDDGNFGTLRLPRGAGDEPADWIPLNIATGLQDPLSLHVHAGADATGLCDDGINGAIVSDVPFPGLREKTNCVDTDPGLPAGVATAGLIEGIEGEPGLLTTAPTRDGCDPLGGSEERTITIPSHSPFYINDDLLSCYLNDATTSLEDIVAPDYDGGEALIPEIYESPRFFFQPVLGVAPDNGSSDLYSIIDFRPAFITDEVVADTTVKGTHTASTDNGVYFEDNAVKRLKVIFFNMDALPRDDSGGIVTPYMGVGPKIVRLID